MTTATPLADQIGSFLRRHMGHTFEAAIEADHLAALAANGTPADRYVIEVRRSYVAVLDTGGDAFIPVAVFNGADRLQDALAYAERKNR